MRSIGRPDTGLWEIRNGWQEQSFTNLISWAGLERLERITQAGHLKSRSLDVTSARRVDAGALLLDRVLVSASHAGLFSEYFIPSTNTQCGNFLQAYSHAGLINAAFAVSPPWSDVL